MRYQLMKVYTVPRENSRDIRRLDIPGDGPRTWYCGGRGGYSGRGSHMTCHHLTQDESCAKSRPYPVCCALWRLVVLVVFALMLGHIDSFNRRVLTRDLEQLGARIHEHCPLALPIDVLPPTCILKYGHT